MEKIQLGSTNGVAYQNATPFVRPSSDFKVDVNEKSMHVVFAFFGVFVVIVLFNLH